MQDILCRELQMWAERQWPTLGVKLHMAWGDATEALTVRVVLNGGRRARTQIAKQELLQMDGDEAQLGLLMTKIAELVEPAAVSEKSWAPVENPTLTDYVIGFRQWSVREQRLMVAPDADDLSSYSIEEWAEWMDQRPWRGEPIETVTYKLGAYGNGHDVWDGANEVMATCEASGHPAPHPGSTCHCGFNAYHDPSAMPLNRWAGVRNIVWGAIRARGRIEVAAEGFRAQYAQPIALGYLPDQEALTKRVARAVGLPAVAANQIRLMCKEHGAVIAPDMRPDPQSWVQRRGR